MRFGKLTGVLALTTAALIWGLAFSAQRQALEHLGPAIFNSCRSFTGGIALLLLAALLKICRRQSGGIPPTQPDRPQLNTLLLGGLACGCCMAAGSLLQQIGLQYLTAGKAGFLTALYLVLVPVFGICLGRKVHLVLWLAVLISLFGAYLLCQPESGSFGRGDLVMLASAVCFSWHILVIDYFVTKVDVIMLSALQVLVNGCLSLAIGLFRGEPLVWASICAATGPILFCGLGSTGLAFTLQMFGQKLVSPTAASLLMSLESVFAVVGGWLWLHEILSARELTGCAVILTAVIISQLHETASPSEESAATEVP